MMSSATLINPGRSCTQSCSLFAKISADTFVPNGKRSHLNRPCGVANVVSFDDSASNFTCQYPDFRSTVVNILAFDNPGNTSSSDGSL